MTKSILTQSLATEEGEHQARAAAQVHQDVLDTLVRQGKRSLVRVVAKDVLANWVRWNWGDDAAALVPKPSLGTTERTDLPATITAFAALLKTGFPHPSQYAAMDSMFGLPVRDLTQEEAVDDPALTDPSAQPVGENGQPLPSGGSQPQADATKSAPPPPGRVAVRPHERNVPARRQSAAAMAHSSAKGDALDKQAPITEADKTAAVEYWRRHASPKLRDLLDADVA
jgi:hypothetical protein